MLSYSVDYVCLLMLIHLADMSDNEKPHGEKHSSLLVFMSVIE